MKKDVLTLIGVDIFSSVSSIRFAVELVTPPSVELFSGLAVTCLFVSGD